MKKQHIRNLTLARETVRQLSGLDLVRAAGGIADSTHGCAAAVSNPVVSCDSCTNCACKPPLAGGGL